MKTLRITEFINKAFEELQAAAPNGYELSDTVQFELSVAEVSSDGGGIDLKVIKLDDKVESHLVHKLSFTFDSPSKKESDLKLQMQTIGRMTEVMFGGMAKGIAQFEQSGQIQPSIEN